MNEDVIQETKMFSKLINLPFFSSKDQKPVYTQESDKIPVKATRDGTRKVKLSDVLEKHFQLEEMRSKRKI